MHACCTTKKRKCRCMKFCASFPVAPQGRGNGTFLIFLCFCIAKSPSIWVFPVNKTAPTLVCRSSFFHVVKMTVPNSALPVFTAKNCPGQAQGGLSRDSERFLRETSPRGHLPAAEYFSTEGIFQLARKVSAIVGSRAPKPSAASAGYRHETA